MRELVRRLRSFFGELRRRKVFRAAVIYASVAFVVLQAAAIVLPALHLPDWTLTFLVVVAILGFPLVLALEWVYEITSEGVQREPASAPEAFETDGASVAGGRLWRWPLLLMPVAVVLLIGAYLLLPRETVEEAPEPAIAVLPFQLLGPDPADEALADAVAEDIHMSLSQIAGLRVTSLRTSLRYRGMDKSLRTIGEELDVSAVLDGSVRRTGDVLRVSLQLIDVRSDHTL